MERYVKYLEKIISELGLNTKVKEENIVSNSVQSKEVAVGPARITIEIDDFGSKCRVEINFQLPEQGATAETFMDYCATKENIPTNYEGLYASGPVYKDWNQARQKKNTVALSPWHNNYFYVRSENYKVQEIQEAVDNAIQLARCFSSHLKEYDSLKVWDKDEPEVIAKEKEIVANADLHETDIDKEDRAHYLRDRNSFFKGWFFPFRGTFDIIWPASVETTATQMGNKGSFEYAVACRLLMNPEYIDKARKACIIRKKRTTLHY